jgi:phage baseplate assembly protein W
MALYSDVNFTPIIRPVEIVTDADSINQNIAAIFDTPVGSKWFRPSIGSNVNALLFDPIDDITSDALRYEMETALRRNGENRVNFTEVIVIPDPDNLQYYVEIHYNAPQLMLRNQIFRFNLSRGVQ